MTRNDISIAALDGLKGPIQAVEVSFPRATVQTCFVRLIGNSPDYSYGWTAR